MGCDAGTTSQCQSMKKAEDITTTPFSGCRRTTRGGHAGGLPGVDFVPAGGSGRALLTAITVGK
jgi:hypothetical protein